jgi:protein phosphatase
VERADTRDASVVRFYGRSDVGKKRDHNEDAFYFSEEERYALLADGMGGRLYGEVASEMAVSLLREIMRRYLPRSTEILVRANETHARDMLVCFFDDLIRDVNTRIFARGREDARYAEMGTTLAFLYALPAHAIIAHVGDSRIYRYRAGAVDLLTEDHSFVNSQVKAGMMTAAEAELSTQKNIITRAIGTSAKVKPDIRVIPVLSEDVFLLCSDGLSDMLETDDLKRLLGEARTDIELAVEKMIELANEKGGKDNITAIVAVFE